MAHALRRRRAVRTALIASAAVAALFAAGPGAAQSASVDQHVGIVWLAYPGGFFQLHLYPTVHQGTQPGGLFGYQFNGTVNSQSAACGPYDYNVSSTGRAPYLADATLGQVGAGLITGTATSSCGTQSFTLQFQYTGRGTPQKTISPPDPSFTYVGLYRRLTATGTFCWTGGTNACTELGTTNNAYADTVIQASA
jgi:hypothetical protein